MAGRRSAQFRDHSTSQTNLNRTRRSADSAKATRTCHPCPRAPRRSAMPEASTGTGRSPGEPVRWSSDVFPRNISTVRHISGESIRAKVYHDGGKGVPVHLQRGQCLRQDLQLIEQGLDRFKGRFPIAVVGDFPLQSTDRVDRGGSTLGTRGGRPERRSRRQEGARRSGTSRSRAPDRSASRRLNGRPP